MSWRIELAPSAGKDLARIPKQAREGIIRAIDRLVEDPGTVDVLKLRGREAEWRLRVGHWRVRLAFDAPSHAILVQRVLPRGRAYRTK